MILRIVIDVFLAIGVIFALAGVIGINHTPDTFSRMQASTCVSTLGILCMAIGAVLYAACIMKDGTAAVKVAVIAGLVLVINPIGAHGLMKGAYRSGYRPEKEMKIDDFREDFNE